MNDVEKIAIRRATLDWRDKWIAKIPDVLERELALLYVGLDQQIDRIKVTELFNTNKFTSLHLEPVIEAWVVNETRELMKQASEELKQANEDVFRLELDSIKVGKTRNIDSYFDVAAGILSTGGAVASIPTMMTLSVSTSGGILAALGFGTTMVVNWPVALMGITVISGMLYFGKDRVFGIKERRVRKIKEQVRARTREAILGSSEQSISVASRLQEIINKNSQALLEALPDE